MHKGAILPLFYLPPTDFFKKLIANQQNILIEQHEHFPKQTYRNRASIQSPNGHLDLIVPVVRGSKVHTCVKDVKISYDFNWQRIHWMSLQTCYRTSSFFEFYEDSLAPFYSKKYIYLFDFNEQLLQLLLQLLKINITWQHTAAYEKHYPNMLDFRESIHPKKEPDGDFKPYFQVFEDKCGFIKNLSIVDLLFSQGPQSINYL